MHDELKKLSIRINEKDYKKLKLVLAMENQTTIDKIKSLIENYTYSQNRYKENKIKKKMINIKLAVVVPKELKKQLSQSNYCKNSKTISKVARGLVNKYLLDNPNKIDLEYLYSKMKKFYEDKGYIKIDYNSNNRTPSITRNSSINFKMFEFYQDRLDNKIAGLLSKTTLPKILEILLYGYTFEEKITLEEKYFKRVCLTAKIDEKLYNDFKEDRLVKGKLISIQQACEALIKQELIKYNELEKLF